MLRRFVIATLLIACNLISAIAQTQVGVDPIQGLRENPPHKYALVHGNVTVAPGRTLQDATVLIESTTITAVGTEIEIPPGFLTVDCRDQFLYPGLIDAYSDIDTPTERSQAGYWNANVLPERSVADSIGKSIDSAEKLRGQGITVRLVAPRGGIVKGQSCIVLLTDSSAGRFVLKERAFQHLQLTVPRSGNRPRYPNSPMGAVALLRQSLYDASWYAEAWAAYRSTPRLARPETNVALSVLAASMSNQTFVIDAPNERMALRGDAIAREFSLNAILRGSGREYRELDAITATKRPILVPVNFPDPPDLQTQRQVNETSLRDLMHWDLAPENPARLVARDTKICLTTDGLDNLGDYLKQVRLAVQRGLSPDAALAAMTTTPASLLGIADHCGTIAPGKLANLIITDKPLLTEPAKVMQSWVAGEQFVIKQPTKPDPIVATWSIQIPNTSISPPWKLILNRKGDKLSGEIVSGDDQTSDTKSDGDTEDGDTEDGDTEDGDTEDAKTDTEADSKASEDASNEQTTAGSHRLKLTQIHRQRDRLTAWIDFSEVVESADGDALLTITTVTDRGATMTPVASLQWPDGRRVQVKLTRIESTQDADSNTVDNADQSHQEPAVVDSSQETTETPILYPLGAYGVADRSRKQPTILFRGATIWTCDDQGTIANGDLLIRDGRIVEVGTQLAAPPGCRIVDARGKHITPGLIDCHSHMGTDGGVNESGQAVTAEVRIGDFIDHSDMNIYRQLAGGLTTSNILHGSANPIGGQNRVIKLRWGDTMDRLPMQEAPAGIKFALGENVKRNPSRYPNSRMGVEQIIRDQLLAAREYDFRWRRWRNGHRDTLPPRVDLQLQALSEVQRGERWIHCHSYRQDEIVATLDVLEEFGIQIGTLQHILEGYKVADRMARHGAAGSSFSDWWAYKFEVYDAIPYNGALMHQNGVVVSFNSDDRELARRLNTEAAKATKYGGVAEEEALKFVTLNPAKQLRIDQHVGSLAPGKHADLVVWSGRPLSTLTRCEQTWIDGCKYFDLETDEQIQDRDRELKAQLVQKARSHGKPPSKKQEPETEEEDRWIRYDAFCTARGAMGQGRSAGQSRGESP